MLVRRLGFVAKESKVASYYGKLSLVIIKLPRSLTCPTGANEVCVVGGQVLHSFGTFLLQERKVHISLLMLKTLHCFQRASGGKQKE